MHAMTEQTQRTDFSDLVRTRRAELGISLRELEARSIDPDPEPGKAPEQAKFGWISKVEKNQPVDTPSAGLCRALAKGLQLPPRVVKEAAAEQFLEMDPFVWSDDHTTRVLAARIEEMTPDERRQLADIAETFARRKTQRSDGAGGKSDD
jgi:transcriptional regulator with XRE-family HTH domain